MDQKWYQTFTAEDNMPRELLFEVLTAANYMTIKPLLDLCCLKVTFQLTNKSAEEVSLRLDG
jgi:S-phase kinase-associated protein 1